MPTNNVNNVISVKPRLFVLRRGSQAKASSSAFVGLTGSLLGQEHASPATPLQYLTVVVSTEPVGRLPHSSSIVLWCSKQ